MLKSYLLLIIMILLWSFSFVMVDIAVEFMPPLSIAFYRFLVASICFLMMDVYFKMTKKSNKLLFNAEEKMIKSDWIMIIISSLVGISLFFFSQYNAINLIGPSLPALFVCLLSPVIISLLALKFFDEKLNSVKIIGFIIATIGGFLLVTGGDITNFAPASPNFLGYFLALLTPILWGIYSTITKKNSNKMSNFKMLEYICYFGTIELLVFIILSNEFMLFIGTFFNVLLFLCALYLGLGCYIIGYFIWQKSQKNMNSSKVASFLYIEPFITLIFSFLLQRDEEIMIWNIIGGIIVLVAVLVINYEKRDLKKGFN